MIIEKFIRKVVTANPADRLETIGRLMKKHNVGAVVLVEGHKPVGILTDRDLMLALGVQGLPLQTPAAQVMGSPLHTVSQDEGVFATTQTMKELRVRRLPVVDDDGLLTGIVTLDDLIKVLSQELSNVVQGIEPEMAVQMLK